MSRMRSTFPTLVAIVVSLGCMATLGLTWLEFEDSEATLRHVRHESLLARQRLDRAIRQGELSPGRYAAVERVLPETPSVAEVLTRIEAAGKDVQVENVEIPKSENQGWTQFSIRGSGTPEKIAGFLAQLERSQRVIVISSLLVEARVEAVPEFELVLRAYHARR